MRPHSVSSVQKNASDAELFRLANGHGVAGCFVRASNIDPFRHPTVTPVRVYFDRLEAAGKFPRRVSLGERRVARVEREIDAYLDNLISKRSRALGTLGSQTD